MENNKILPNVAALSNLTYHGEACTVVEDKEGNVYLGLKKHYHNEKPYYYNNSKHDAICVVDKNTDEHYRKCLFDLFSCSESMMSLQYSCANFDGFSQALERYVALRKGILKEYEAIQEKQFGGYSFSLQNNIEEELSYWIEIYNGLAPEDNRIDWYCDLVDNDVLKSPQKIESIILDLEEKVWEYHAEYWKEMYLKYVPKENQKEIPLVKKDGLPCWRTENVLNCCVGGLEFYGKINDTLTWKSILEADNQEKEKKIFETYHALSSMLQSIKTTPMPLKDAQKNLPILKDQITILRGMYMSFLPFEFPKKITLLDIENMELEVEIIQNSLMEKLKNEKDPILE